MMILRLLILFQLQALVYGQRCNVPGECFGYSIDTELLDSERECLEHCKSFEKCEWYTFDSSIGYCDVLEDCSEIDETCTTCISGEKECKLPLMCFVPGDCSGKIIDHVVVTSAEECLEQCYNDYPTCNYFSFYPEGDVCNLYETCILDGSESDVISGEKDCYQDGYKAPTKILLQENSDTAWIHMPSFNDSGEAITCNQPTDYPLNKDRTVSQVINGSITVCGGYESNACFSLNSALNIWVEFDAMNVHREGASSVMTSNGWWVTGGYGSGSPLSSTSLWDGSTWKVGPTLPSIMSFHCMVQVNLTHTFVADRYEAYLYDWTTYLWTDLPDLNVYLTSSLCALFEESLGNTFILTAGGINSYYEVRSIDLSNPDSWQVLPHLPTPVSNGGFVQDGDDLIIVNGYYLNLLLFNEDTRTFSIVPGQTLPSAFGQYTTVLAIQDESLNGCN